VQRGGAPAAAGPAAGGGAPGAAKTVRRDPWAGGLQFKPSPNFVPPPPPPAALNSETAALTLGVGAAACALGERAAAAAGEPSLRLLLSSLAALALAAAARRALVPAGVLPITAAALNPFAGASQLASTLMGFFFAALGAAAGSPACLLAPQTAALAAFVLLMCAVHGLVLAAFYAAVRPPLPALLLGSNACVGGPATAAAMAAARGWAPLAQPALLAASMGYVLGTAAGLLVARLVGA